MKTQELIPSVHDFTLCSMGHSAFQYLYAGFELGVFELLANSPGLSEAKIARGIRLGCIPGRCLVFGLTSLGFLAKEGSGYLNSSLIMWLFEFDKIVFVKKFLRFQAAFPYAGQIDFIDSLLADQNIGLNRIAGDGVDVYHRIAGDDFLREVFFDFMSAWSAENLPLLLDVVDFSRFNHIVDIGGGDATVSLGIAGNCKGVSIDLVDIPDVCPLARERIAVEALDSRISVIPCNVIKEEFPGSYDCVLFSVS